MKKLLLVSAIAFAGVFAQADFVNGSFETGDFTGWTTVDASSASDFGVSEPSFFGFDAVDGTYFVYFGAFGGSPDTISQTLSTTVGQSYTLSFYAGEDGTGTEENLEVTDNGTALYNSAAPSVVGSDGEYQLEYFSYTVVGTGSDTFAFAGQDVPSYIGLDDVHLTPTSAPEPASMTLLGIGAAGVLLRRKAAKR